MNIAIICGGPSCEHEVSLQSAVSIFDNIDKKKYNVKLIGMTKTGLFITGKNLILNKNDPKKILLNPKAKKVIFSQGKIDAQKIQLVFPIIHGTFGEDGCIQGFLKTYKLSFVGEDVKTSALTMDKQFTKDVLTKSGLLSTPYQVFYKTDKKINLKSIITKLGSHLFVKPASLGSSVGISQCFNQAELKIAVTKAFKYDEKIIIEKAALGREIEIGLLGSGENLQISAPSEIKSENNFYSYEAKYIKTQKAKTITPAELSASELKKLRDLAQKIYKTLECRALARVDFFLTKDGFLFNEINTMPGFTKISMYPQMFIKSGISYTALIDKLIKICTK